MQDKILPGELKGWSPRPELLKLRAKPGKSEETMI
jgi:hypothetical protein